MPHVRGMTLCERLELGPLKIDEALVVARGLLTSLAAIHARGHVYGNVKPTNVIVESGPPVRSAALADVGSADVPSEPAHDDTTDCSELRYMAPELAGVLDRPVDVRADLYSVGIVLFECLVGRPPFQGDVAQTLRQHLSEPSPRLRSLGVPIPQALEEIVRRLLLKDPDDRYGSAEAVLADIDALDAGLRNGEMEPVVAVGAHDSRNTLTDPSLVGRETELLALAQRLAEANRGRAALVAIEAGSGGGKSAVLTEFTERASAFGARVFRGRGVEHAVPKPLQMLTGIVHDLVGFGADDPALVERISAALGDAAARLCAALPELSAIIDAPSGDEGHSEAHARLRLVNAILVLLESLGEPSRPAIIALDDCQWADELTLQALEAWNTRRIRTGTAPCHVLIVAAVRNEPSSQYRRLIAIPCAQSLVLPPLNDRQVCQVIESMAGHVPAPASDVIVELSRGNPLMVSAVLRGLIEAGALAPGEGGWQFVPNSGSWQASREAASFLTRRFALLSPQTRELLDAAAILGREFDLDLAATLAGQDYTQARYAMRPAVERHLVWASTEGRFTFAHDKLRDSLLAQLDPLQLSALHMAAAEHIENRDASQTFEIAYHFDAASAPARAFDYAVQSAHSARAHHDFELAERLYRIAERGLPHADERTRYRVLEALGQVLMLRGRYPEAAERFEKARLLATDDISLAGIEGQLGEVLFRQDDLEGSARLIENALRVLGESVSSGGNIRILLRILIEVLGRGLSALRLRRRSLSDSARQRDRLRAHLYTQLQYPSWFDSRRLRNLSLMMRQVNVAERCPGSPELAHAYAVWSAALALTFPFTWRYALRFVDRSQRIYTSLGDLRGEGHTASMRACILHAGGRYVEAAESATSAVQILGQFGDRWEVGFATRTNAVCLYRLGRFTEARAEARRLAEIGANSADAQANTAAAEVLAKAGDGDVPAALTQPELGVHTADIEVTVAALQAEALRLRRAGQLTEGIAKLETAVCLVRSSQPTSTHLVPVFAWLATLQREDAEVLLLPHVRRRRLRLSLRSARRAVRYGRFYPNDLPHALRELGVVHALLGHRWRARRCLMGSCAAAKRRSAWAELADTLFQLDRVAFTERSKADWHSRDLDPDAKVGRLASTNWGRADRFSALLHAEVVLASADSPDAVGIAIDQVVRSLLRAEQCRLIALRPQWRLISPEVSDVEQEVAERAAQYGRPLVMGDSANRDHVATGGLTVAGARSALCAPIFVRGEVAGCFLAVHSQVGGLFGEVEIQLAEFVARLAGNVVERLELQREVRAEVISAQEAERARVARDLHDDIGQELTSVLLGVRLVETAAPIDVHARVAELRQGVAHALESVQRLAFDLRPTVLDDLGLLDALRRLVGNISTVGTRIELESVGLHGGERLAPDIETTAYRITQEAITNVIRHARASKCSVVVGLTESTLRVVVEDDGVGFEPGATRPRGLGQLGMHERAALVNGVLVVASAPGEGTQVLFEVIV
ncbi:AAA family ATPase [Mycobacterium florentinum]|nr:AAA family ATPase [Mycobacterium florentinum]